MKNRSLAGSLSLAAISVVCMFISGTAMAAATLVPGVLSVGSDMTLPPYTYSDHGKPSGFDPEFIGAVASYMKDTSKFVDTRFANLILGITGNRYDIVASALYVTPERAKVVDYVPYFMTGGSLMVSATSGLNPKTVGDLCGKRIGSINGAAWIKFINNASDKYCVAQGKPAVQVREYDTSAETAQAVLSGGVDAQYEDVSIAGMIVERSGGRLKVTSNGPLDPVVCGIALRKGNAELKSQIESAIAQMKSKGEYQALLKKYHVTAPTDVEVAKALGTAQ
ncbi:ABC transporter substrate-binding protein [Trinickia dinghuensis]|uniref:ABC transporter substrate-binding protein n=1 Tax=Trinickia dinghuensis TaxID=2291023 RepID=A0A3D8K6E1_9BURK|nr:ABC transporter substrate-binding protein [Trinickia dinghuensis]RDV00466.1 ABC transporter substrate-binding protein [Trinickia dinghuensis]